MTGSGWDVHGTPDNTLTHDTHGHTPDTGTSVVSQLDHDESGGRTLANHITGMGTGNQSDET